MSDPQTSKPGNRSTARGSLLFTAGTLVSRVSGVLRESVVGAVFGAGTAMDAFIVAYRIPNLLRELIAEGALGSSFTKVYTATAEKDAKAARRVFEDTARLVFMLGLLIVCTGIIASPWLVDLMSRRDASEDSELFTRIAVRQTQLLFPTVAIFALASIVTGALHKKGSFFLSAVSPAAFNVANIAGALLVTPLLLTTVSPEFATWLGDAGITGLSIGVLAGSVMQLWMAARGLAKEGVKIRLLPAKNEAVFPWTAETKRILWLMGPMAIAASSGIVNFVVNTNFATALGKGAVTWINFAFRFLQLPVGLFGVAIGAAVLPALTRAITRAGNKVDDTASIEVCNAIEMVAWLMLPCFALFHVCAPQIIGLFYEAGKFTASDTQQTALALQAYSYGLLSYGLLKVLNSYYYATERTRYAMWVGIFSIAVNYIGNLLLVERYGHRGLALTASVTLTCNTLLLLAGMTRDRVKVDLVDTLKSLLLISAATTAAVFAQRGTFPWDAVLPPGSKKLLAASQIAANGLIVVAVFAPFLIVRLKTGKSEFSHKFRRLMRLS
ncbi:MAG: murein biosynthesis integral rane protein MurJ [Pseudomonadota bacterium]|jgi:putative peptidoglycan lipid II flippase